MAGLPSSSQILRWQTKIRKLISKNIKCLETYRFRIESGRYFVYQKRRFETRSLQGSKQHIPFRPKKRTWNRKKTPEAEATKQQNAVSR